MNWYKNAQSDIVSPTQRAPKYHNGQNVIVYSDVGDDSKTGAVQDSQFIASEDEYAYMIRFDEPDKTFKEDRRYREKDIIPY